MTHQPDMLYKGIQVVKNVNTNDSCSFIVKAMIHLTQNITYLMLSLQNLKSLNLRLQFSQTQN